MWNSAVVQFNTTWASKIQGSELQIDLTWPYWLMTCQKVIAVTHTHIHSYAMITFNALLICMCVCCSYICIYSLWATLVYWLCSHICQRTNLKYIHTDANAHLALVKANIYLPVFNANKFKIAKQIATAPN